MNTTHTEPTILAKGQETAVDPTEQEAKLITLFNEGWSHLINQQWQQAEATFAQIESFNSHYEQDGLRASYLREKAQFERVAETAWKEGELEAALAAFKKADDFDHAKEVYELLTIQELEAKAERLAAFGDYQAAAWIYDHLLTEFTEHEKETNWQIKKESCWEAELLPYFQLGVDALTQEKWLTAYGAFAQVLATDPYYRQDGRSAAALSEVARKEVVLLADQQLRQGQIQAALEMYRTISHLARIENVDEFLRLRQHEEQSAKQLEMAGQWQAAANKYSYLRTLYYDENGRTQWQAAANHCLEESRLNMLYEQANTAFNHKQWHKAEKLLRQIIDIRPDYQPGKLPARKLYRTARWHAIFSRFAPDSGNPPPKVQTGNLS